MCCRKSKSDQETSAAFLPETAIFQFGAVHFSCRLTLRLMEFRCNDIQGLAGILMARRAVGEPLV